MTELQDKSALQIPEATFKSFLEETPPDTVVRVKDLNRSSKYVANTNSDCPEVLLFCTSESCSGPRLFSCDHPLTSVKAAVKREFLRYICNNCGLIAVHFALTYSVEVAPTHETLGQAIFMKFGQIPTFGAQIPSRLMTLIGPDRDVFLQGYRAETRGMGIGAFAYYRRVVENQKNRIIGEIAKVATSLGSSAEADVLFQKAMNETQFSSSVGMVKGLLPQSLMIRGQNPLTLLHSALSKGLHDPEMTDAHCLAIAQSIRTILVELAERSSEALRTNKEIQTALSVLMGLPNYQKAAKPPVVD